MVVGIQVSGRSVEQYIPSYFLRQAGRGDGRER